MKIFVRLFVISVLVVLFNCTTKEYILPDRPPQLVVNGVLQANQPARVYIGRSWLPTEAVPTPHFISTALVLIFMEGQIIDTLQHQGVGIYTGNPKRNLVVGKSYIIRVSVVNFTSAYSNAVRIPAPFPLNGIYLDKKTPVLGLNGTSAGPVLIQTRLNGAKPSDEYYGVSIRPMYQKYRLGTAISAAGFANQNFDNECFISTSLPRDIQSVLPYESAFFFKAMCVNEAIGSTISLVAETKGGLILDNGTFQQATADRFVITFINSTSDYPLNRQSSQGPEGLESAFIDPKPTFTNINNGFGIISAFNSQTLVVLNK